MGCSICLVPVAKGFSQQRITPSRAVAAVSHGRVPRHPPRPAKSRATAPRPACAARAEGGRRASATVRTHDTGPRPRTHHTPTYKSADSESRAVRMRHAHALHRCRTGCGTTYPRATPRGSRKVKRRRHVHAQRATQGGSSRRSRPKAPFVCPPAAAYRPVGW